MSDDYLTMKPTPQDKADASDAAPNPPTTAPASSGKRGKNGLTSRVKGRAKRNRRDKTHLGGESRERARKARIRSDALPPLRRRQGSRWRSSSQVALPTDCSSGSYRRHWWPPPYFACSPTQADKSPSATAKDVGMGVAMAATVNQAAVQAGRAAPILLVMGLVIMLWASRGVLKALRLVSAIAWRMTPVPLPRKSVRPWRRPPS